MAATLVITAGCCDDRPGPRAAPQTAVRSGEEIFADCQLCHSTREMQRGPVLDGLPAWYLVGQLEKYARGWHGQEPANRSAALMASALGSLQGPREFERVAAHIAALPPQPAVPTVRGEIAAGRKIYARCAPCHGARAEGNPAVEGPPLDVQEDWYLLDQLRRYQAGLRGNHPEDAQGRAMATAAATLDPAQMRDVVAFVRETFRRGGEVPRRRPRPDPGDGDTGH